MRLPEGRRAPPSRHAPRPTAAGGARRRRHGGATGEGLRGGGELRAGRRPTGAVWRVGGGDPDPAEKKLDPEQFLKPPDITAVSKKNVSLCETAGVAMRKRSHESPGLRKSPLGPSPKRLSPWGSSPRKDHTLSSFNLSPRQLITTPQAKRRSWCRSSLKGTKRRKSLPPVHQDVTELSKSISLDLPEIDRLSMLLLSSFQFSAQKLEHVLKQTDGFSPEAFKANVHSVSEDLKRYVQKLKRDGTLKSCVEDPKAILLDSALDESVAQVKEYLARFAAECRSWDQLLLRYQESAEEMSRQLEERRGKGGRAEPAPHLQTSQAGVFSGKPNYQQILDDQGEVLSCVELVLDELQQAVKLLQAFSEDSRQYLRRLSEQLATRTFRQLENSPARKLIAAPRRKTPND
ncbi:kinetochore-associated protein DSN1 homolog isoform X1 [Calonectris borealis]|uniref:kinetochore-associated protein DSN1 homolog isoform X1 n=1 Tax=Calonectris borealis TaxID=1323832 RepID=UPI003F4C0B49